METTLDLFKKLKSFCEPELQSEILKHPKFLKANKGDILIKEGQYLNFLPIVNCMKSIMTFKMILMVSIVACGLDVGAQTETKREDKMKVLVHITNGPENPTKAALGFLMAKTAVEEGYAVTLFLAGDAVQLLRNDVLDNLAGLGTGKLKDHYDTIVKGGGRFYLSGMSGKSRGVIEADLKDKPAEFAMPKVLLQLSMDSDRMFVY